MPNARPWAELKKLSNAELIREHDEIAKSTVVGTAHYIEEIRYRQQLRFTKLIAVLTAIITLATIYGAL